MDDHKQNVKNLEVGGTYCYETGTGSNYSYKLKRLTESECLELLKTAVDLGDEKCQRCGGKSKTILSEGGGFGDCIEADSENICYDLKCGLFERCHYSRS